MWYKNYDQKAKYHKVGSDWVSTGRAVCGRSVAHPTFTVRTHRLDTDRPYCRDCVRKTKKQ